MPPNADALSRWRLLVVCITELPLLLVAPEHTSKRRLVPPPHASGYRISSINDIYLLWQARRYTPRIRAPTPTLSETPALAANAPPEPGPAGVQYYRISGSPPRKGGLQRPARKGSDEAESPPSNEADAACGRSGRSVAGRAPLDTPARQGWLSESRICRAQNGAAVALWGAPAGASTRRHSNGSQFCLGDRAREPTASSDALARWGPRQACRNSSDTYWLRKSLA